jgi:hypothetical protein
MLEPLEIAKHRVHVRKQTMTQGRNGRVRGVPGMRDYGVPMLIRQRHHGFGKAEMKPRQVEDAFPGFQQERDACHLEV